MTGPVRKWAWRVAWLMAAALRCVIVSAQVGGAVCTPGSALGGLIGGPSVGVSLLGALAGASSGAAGCTPAEPASRAPEEPSRLAGNPFDVLTGAKVDRAVDLHVPASSGVAALASPVELVFSRLYSSQGAGSEGFGPGWRHSFDTRLHASRDGHGQTTLQVLQADGRAVLFGPGKAVGGGLMRHPASQRDDGALDRRTVGRSSVWTWRWRDGRELVFRDDGRLVRVSDQGGVRLTLAYDRRDRLVAVADAGARQMTLHYDDAPVRSASAQGLEAYVAPAAARIAAVSAPGGARLEYRYDARGRLAGAVHADGSKVGYRYADHGRAWLAGITLPDGATSEYRYDRDGRVVYSRAPGAGDPQAWRVTYAIGPEGDEGDTLVTHGAGASARYRWSLIEGERRLVGADGEGCRRCPPTGVRYAYRGGRVASASSAERRLEFVRDDSGRLVEVLKHAAEASRDPGGATAVSSSALREASDRPHALLAIRWADDPLLDRPLRVARPSSVADGLHVLQFEYDRSGRIAVMREHGYRPAIEPGAGGARVTGFVPVARKRPLDVRHAPPQSSGPLALPADAVPKGGGAWEAAAGNGAITRYWLDDFGRVVAALSPDSGLSRWLYDDSGRIAVEVAADGTRARYRHDAAGNLVERTVLSSGRAPVSTRYRYEAGRLSGIDHPEQSERYAYGDDGRLVRHSVHLRLESARVVRLDTQYRYQAGTGLLVAMSLPDGSWLRMARDAKGQIMGMHRDSVGRRDAMGQSAESLGAAGSVPARASLIDDIVRDRGGIASARFGNGVRMSVARDPAGRPARICHRSGDVSGAGCDVLDHDLDFDAQGRLRLWRRGAVTLRQRFAPDGALLQSTPFGAGAFAGAWRYAYDANGNRVLAQTPDGVTTAGAVEDGSNRIVAVRSSGVDGMPSLAERSREWDAAGRLLREGDRRYRWTPDGLLAEVSDAGSVVARYRYNHRGERIARRTAAGTRHFLSDASRRPLAELDEHGRILRLYAYLADLPVALIDRTPTGERTVLLHLNHLGAPEAATDDAGSAVWRGAYAPFGRLLPSAVGNRPPSPSGRLRPASMRARDRSAGAAGAAGAAFEQPLRLPGQYEDPETGLHYNDHRYYDPDAGRYLSPDPLGLRGGPNPYAYAGNDPLARVDPTGLLLFAFDGTGNSDPPPGRDDWSNVYKLARSYGDGRVWYMAGVGRDDAASGIRGDALDAVSAYTARSRVDYMLGQLEQTAGAQSARGRWLDVDIIGFSRGAAMGRDFANRVADRIASGAYLRAGACVRLRFLGIWDTVAQFGLAGTNDLLWRLSIPAGVAYTAHAVALNEHRVLFPGESIARSPLGGVRIERGFIGAHSDVGGSYSEGDLSDVALGWMHAQAGAAGVRMFALTSEFARVTEPLLHDSSGGAGDREFRIRNGFGLTMIAELQRVAPVEGMRWRDTAAFIRRYAAPKPDAYGASTLAGEVDLEAYASWLRSHYAFSIAGGP